MTNRNEFVPYLQNVGRWPYAVGKPTSFTDIASKEFSEHVGNKLVLNKVENYSRRYRI